jgi:hypothetical protein
MRVCGLATKLSFNNFTGFQIGLSDPDDKKNSFCLAKMIDDDCPQCVQTRQWAHAIALQQCAGSDL